MRCNGSLRKPGEYDDLLGCFCCLFLQDCLSRDRTAQLQSGNIRQKYQVRSVVPSALGDFQGLLVDGTWNV